MVFRIDRQNQKALLILVRSEKLLSFASLIARLAHNRLSVWGHVDEGVLGRRQLALPHGALRR
jgi:hypothetical protein